MRLLRLDGFLSTLAPPPMEQSYGVASLVLFDHTRYPSDEKNEHWHSDLEFARYLAVPRYLGTMTVTRHLVKLSMTIQDYSMYAGQRTLEGIICAKFYLVIHSFFW